MKSFFALILFLIFLQPAIFAQSARAKTAAEDSINTAVAEPDAEALYKEANEYTKAKFTEFEQKKLPFNESVRQAVVRDQRQLAAKNAAKLEARNLLTGNDFYYLGMLHWIAGNWDGTLSAMLRFLTTEEPEPEKAQTARSGIVVINARKKNFEEAEKFLAEYISTGPIKLRDHGNMERELALSYREKGDLDKAAPHAEEAYKISKSLFSETKSRSQGISDIFGAGKLLFEIYRDKKDPKQVEATLSNFARIGAYIESSTIYYYAIDNRIKYLIEIGNKTQAMQFYESALKKLDEDFPDFKDLRQDIERRLKKRERHYKLLGSKAPELSEIANWFPSGAKSISSLKGKVILLDFWAMWCGPCYDAYPYLSELQLTRKQDGFEILGITRFYGEFQGSPVDEPTEINYLKKFRLEQKLPYDFVVSKNATNHINYGAPSLPTAVIIDREGIVRYIESGSGPGREEEIRGMVEKLLAEK